MTKPKEKSPDELLAEDLSQFYDDPLGHVMYSYPWDTDASIQVVKLKSPWKERFNCEYGPDEWACQFLDDLASEVKKRGFDGQNAVDPIRFATASGHGIGKSVLVAWLIKWIMDTRPLCRGTVTANTDTQLRTKTWAELGKWNRMSATAHWFNYSSARGSMSLRHKDLPEEWFCTAQTSREENSESFAGQHAANSTSFYIFDEASGVPTKIYEVREGGLSDGEPMTFDFGNPTRNSGRFFEECVGSLRHRHIVRQIDSRDVAITNKKLHAQYIEDFGIDSDFVKVRVLGQFPSAGSTQFIGMDEVEMSMGREITPNSRDPLVLGCDVARFGHNESVIYPRLGRDARSFGIGRFKGLKTTQLVGKVIERVKEFALVGKRVRAIFVDGGGVGGGVVDMLQDLGYPVHDVNFGSAPTDTKKYKFKVDEMWGRMRDWLRSGGAIPGPNEPGGNDLKAQLTAREFGYTLAGNKIRLETKEVMQERGVDSPDLADGLCITFAEEVATALFGDELQGQKPREAVHDYDPLEEPE